MFLLSFLPFLLLPLIFLAVRRGAGVRDVASGVVSAGLWWAALLALLSEGLSTLGLLRPVPLLVASVTLLGGSAYALRSEIGRGLAEASLARLLSFFKRDRYPFPRLVVGAITLVNLPLLFLYTNNVDSVVYHLPRVYHWLQNGNLEPYVTGDVRQIYISSLSSQLASVSVGQSGSALFVNLIQFLAYLGCCVGLFRVGSLMFGSGAAGRWAAVFFATIPTVVLEATTPQTDVIAAVFVVFAIERYLTFVESAGEAAAGILVGNPLSELMVAAALGVAAKASVGPMLAVLCLLAAVTAARNFGYRLATAALGGGLVGAAVLAPPLRRLWNLFPDLRTPHHDLLFVGSFEPLAGLVNWLRYSMQSLVSLQVVWGELPEWIGQAVDRWSLAAGATPEDLAAWTFNATGYAPENRLFHDSLSYDPKVYVALVVVAAVVPVCLLAKIRWHRSRVVAVLLVALSGWAVFFLQFNWQPWGGRLQIPYAAVLSALAGGLLATRGRIVALVAGVVFASSLTLGLMSSVMNEGKSTISWTAHRGNRVVPWWDRPPVAAIIRDRRVVEGFQDVVEVLREEPARRIGLLAFGGEEFVVWKTLVEAHGILDLPRVYHLRQTRLFPAGVSQGRLPPEDLDTLDYIVVRLRRPRHALHLPDGWCRHPATSDNALVFVLLPPPSPGGEPCPTGVAPGALGRQGGG